MVKIRSKVNKGEVVPAPVVELEQSIKPAPVPAVTPVGMMCVGCRAFFCVGRDVCRL